jgi:hypothetical protein
LQAFFIYDFKVGYVKEVVDAVALAVEAAI